MDLRSTLTKLEEETPSQEVNLKMQEEISSLTVLLEKTRNKNADLTQLVTEQKAQVLGGRLRFIFCVYIHTQIYWFIYMN